MQDLDQEERTRLAENARRKFLANSAVNHRDAIVYIDSREANEDGQSTIINVWIPREPT